MVVRPPRIEHAGGVFHVVARGNERALVFRDDRDRFLEILNGWRSLSLAGAGLLSDGESFHLLVMTLEPTLARGMRQMNGLRTVGTSLGGPESSSSRLRRVRASMKLVGTGRGWNEDNLTRLSASRSEGSDRCFRCSCVSCGPTRPIVADGHDQFRHEVGTVSSRIRR